MNFARREFQNEPDFANYASAFYGYGNQLYNANFVQRGQQGVVSQPLQHLGSANIHMLQNSYQHASIMKVEPVVSSNHPSEPSYTGASPLLSEKAKQIIRSRRERMNRPRSPSPDVMSIEDDRGYISQEIISRNSTERVVKTLDSTYEHVVKLTNITSEERINKLISMIKASLNDMNVQPYEFQGYVENYLSRMITEKKWTSLTVSTAIFLTVAAPVQVEQDAADAWYKCLMCKYAYPPSKFSCSMCGQKFKSKPDLFVHELEQHGNFQSEHSLCEVCGMTFPKNPLGLRSHFRVHHMCQFEHLECMFGCKSLVLETHSRALAEHVYSCHACIECNDLLSSSLDKHLELFHSSLTTIDYEPDSKAAPGDAFTMGSSPRGMQHQDTVRQKRQRSPSEDDGAHKRMARDRGTTFDEAKSFIDRLLDSGDPGPNDVKSEPCNLADTQGVSLRQANAMGIRNNSSNASSLSGVGASALSLEDEINMMFARNCSRSKDQSGAKVIRKGIKNQGTLGELLFSQVHVKKKVPSGSPGHKEDSPNELVILSDGQENSRRENVRKQLGDNYCEQLLNRGKATVPIYDNGLYYGGSPTRDVSPDPLGQPMDEQLRIPVKDGGRNSRTPRQYRKKSLSSSPKREVLKMSSSKTSKSRSPQKFKKDIDSSAELGGVKESKCSKRSSKITCKTCQLTIPREGFTCRICKSNYVMESDLALHMKAKHQLRVPIKLTCTFCHKQLTDVSALHRHLLSRHVCREHVRCPFECDILLSLDNIKQHLQQEHDRNYCSDCGKHFNKAKSHSCKHKKKVGIDKGELHSLLSGADGVFSDDEFKIVEVPNSADTVSCIKEELVVLKLSAEESGSSLNVRRNRSGLAPMAPVELSKAVIGSRDFEMYERSDLFYCKKCPLVYNGGLNVCLECDLLFLDAKHLAFHAIEVHKCAMDMKDIECDFCDKTFGNYRQLLSHRSSHFCGEHTECSEGCRELIVGKNLALNRHLKKAHNGDAKEPSKVLLGHVSSEAAETPKANDEISDLIKCSNCCVRVPANFELICDKCSHDNQLKFYTQDELTLHQEKQHRISKRGKYVCSLCEVPQTFGDDLDGLMAHRNKVHRVCRGHVKCPRKECAAIMSSGKLENHLRKECDFVSASDWSLHPWFVFNYTEIKTCYDCSFALQTTKLYKCPECKGVMADKLEFYAHLKFDHKHDEVTHDINFSCGACNTSATSFDVGRWRSHRKEKHGYCANHFACVNMSCSLMFDSLYALKKHLRSERCKFKVTVKVPEFLGKKACVSCNQLKNETIARYCGICMPKPGVRPFTDNDEFSMHLTYRHNKAVQSISSIRCDVCKSHMDDFADLGNHRRRKHKICNKHVFCHVHNSCQFVFHFKEALKSHACTADKHKSDRKTISKAAFYDMKTFFKCADCSFTANIRTSKAFICEYERCFKSFLVQNELCDHQLRRHKLSVCGTFQCFRCPGTPSFPNSPDKLADHNQKVHKFCRYHKKCPTPGCNWLFNSENDINDHLEWCLGLKKYAEELPSSRKEPKVSSPEKPSSRGDEDSHKAKRQRSLAEEGEWNENRAVGKESLNKYVCTQFSRKVEIPDPVLFQCVDCTKKFWVDTLIECTKCGDNVPKKQKRFLSRNEMTAHLEAAHNVITFGSTSCLMCSEKFGKSTELQRHMKSAHNSCENHYPCEYCVTGCSKMFGTLKMLETHYASEHGGEKMEQQILQDIEGEEPEFEPTGALVSYDADDDDDEDYYEEPEEEEGQLGEFEDDDYLLEPEENQEVDNFKEPKILVEFENMENLSEVHEEGENNQVEESEGEGQTQQSKEAAFEIKESREERTVTVTSIQPDENEQEEVINKKEKEECGSLGDSEIGPDLVQLTVNDDETIEEFY